jgi:hypothetical protein
MISLKDAEKFYKKGLRPAHKVIKKYLKRKKGIVHGSRAINAYLPSYLDKPLTEWSDWDIFAENPRKVAKEIEKRFDKRYGGNYFVVKPGKHKGTYKIICRVTGKEIADVTVPDREIPHRRIRGINYATLDYHVKKIKEILANPEAKYRWKKDKETLQRIKIFLKKHKSKRRRSRPKPKNPFKQIWRMG